MTPRTVVLGNGALGSAVIRELHRRRDSIRVVSRRAAGLPAGVQHWAGDLTDARTVAAACVEAEIVFHCAMPQYHRWTADFPALHAAIIEGVEAGSASLVWGDNMYAYGRTRGAPTEETPVRAHTRKGVLRAGLADQLMAAHATGDLRATIVRASDFYGPGARLSTAGDFVFERLLAGKSAQWLGDPHVPHAFTHIDDFASAMVAVSQSDAAWGRVWHAPTISDLSPREFIAEVARQSGGPSKVAIPPKVILRVLGLVNPALRETFEMEYEREEPFLVDSSRFEAAFGVRPTPLGDGIAQTIAWYHELPLVEGAKVGAG